jgi:hypothetical protein
MAMAMAAYLGSMAAALTVLVALWNGIIGTPAVERVQQPHPVVAIEQTAAPEQDRQPGPWGPPVIHKPADGSDVASVVDVRAAAAKQAVVEKNRRLKLAREQKREMLAKQHDDEINEASYSTALGYGQEPASTPVFNLFGPHRF